MKFKQALKSGVPTTWYQRIAYARHIADPQAEEKIFNADYDDCMRDAFKLIGIDWVRLP